MIIVKIRKLNVNMKSTFCILAVIIISLIYSCSVVRDHPKSVPDIPTHSYIIMLQIRNDGQILHEVRNACTMIKHFAEWNIENETERYILVNVSYQYMSPTECNRLLKNLYEMPGLRVLNAKANFLNEFD